MRHGRCSASPVEGGVERRVETRRMIIYTMDDCTTDGGRYCHMPLACNCCDAEQVKQTAAECEAENESPLNAITPGLAPDSPTEPSLLTIGRPEQKASGYG